MYICSLISDIICHIIYHRNVFRCLSLVPGSDWHWHSICLVLRSTRNSIFRCHHDRRAMCFAVTALGKGPMGSALMGSLHCLCVLTKGLLGYSR